MKDYLIQPVVFKDRDPERYEAAKQEMKLRDAELCKLLANTEAEAREEYAKMREPIRVVSWVGRDSPEEICAMQNAAQKAFEAEEYYVQRRKSEVYQDFCNRERERVYKEAYEKIPYAEKFAAVIAMLNSATGEARCDQKEFSHTVLAQVPQVSQETVLPEDWHFDFASNSLDYFDGKNHHTVTNYTARVTGWTKMWFHDKSLNYELVDLDVVIGNNGNGKRHHFRVLMKQLSNLAEHIENQYGYASHIPGFSKTRVNEMFRYLIAGQLNELEPTYCYKQPGWWKQGNRFRYVYDGCDLGTKYISDTQTSFIRGELWPVDTSLKLLLQLEQKVIVPMLSFGVLSLTSTLLEQTETPLRFTMFLYGPTGTMKTAFAKAIFSSMVDEKDKLGASFQDTSAAIEKMLGVCSDRAFCVDDNHPATGEMRRNMDTNLEKILRLVSEHISRKRCNVNMELNKSLPASCGVVITGEVGSKIKSSLLRIFNIQFCEEYFKNSETAKVILTQLQKNEGIVNSLWLCVVQYVEAKQEQFLQWYEESVMQKRAFLIEQGNTEELRLATATAQLWTAWELLLKAVKEVASVALTDAMHDIGVQAILYALYETDDTAQNSEPTKIYAKGILDAISMNLLMVAPDIDTFKKAYAEAQNCGKPNRFDGFYDVVDGENCLLLLHAKALLAVNEVQKKKNDEYRFKDNINGDLLAKHPSMVKANDRNLYRTTIAPKKRERFLCLQVEKLEQLATEL